MKKQLALITILFAIIGTNAFAQGYVIFLTAKNNAYDEFTTPGTGVVAPGDVTAPSSGRRREHRTRWGREWPPREFPAYQAVGALLPPCFLPVGTLRPI
jgi:hypothetical protein